MMRSCVKKVVGTVLGIAIFSYMVLFPIDIKTAQATYTQGGGVKLSEDARNTLLKGTTKYNGKDYSGAPYYYNPLYYYLNYSDLREAYGADPAKLIEHFVNYGIAEKRTASKQIVKSAETVSGSFEYIVPSGQKTKTKEDGMVVISGNVHSNGGMTRDQEVQARDIAYQIANYVALQANPDGKYDDGDHIKMIAYATGVVRAYCDLGTYTTEGKIYRTAYGVFVGREYSCAGATRALGLVLDYLDAYYTDDPPLKWVHVNANTWNDQWCQIVCDKHEAYADPVSAWAGYGKHPNEGGSKKDVQTYVNMASESDIISVKPQNVD